MYPKGLRGFSTAWRTARAAPVCGPPRPSAPLHHLSTGLQSFLCSDAGGTNLAVGQTVAALMGEMGRAYDGGYAEYTLVPRERVLPVRTTLPWDLLASLPETYLTAWGSLTEAMEVRAGQTLLIRGGTSSVGMAAASLAKGMGLRVFATTRAPAKAEGLRANGADDVIIDTGLIAEDVRQRVPPGVDGVLELVGTATLLDSLRAVRPGGIVCNTGILGNAWVLECFEPLEDIPSTVRLTTYHSGTTSAERSTVALQKIVGGPLPREPAAPLPLRRNRGGASVHGGEPGERQARCRRRRVTRRRGPGHLPQERVQCRHFSYML